MIILADWCLDEIPKLLGNVHRSVCSFWLDALTSENGLVTGPSYIEFGFLPRLAQIVLHGFIVSKRRFVLILGGLVRRHVANFEPAVP